MRPRTTPHVNGQSRSIGPGWQVSSAHLGQELPSPHTPKSTSTSTVDQDSTVTNATSAIYLNFYLALCKLSYNHLASTVPDSSPNVTMPSLESTRSALNNQPVSPLLDTHPLEVTSSITEAFKKTLPSPPSHQVHLCTVPSSTAALGSAPYGGES